ncbi:MAG: hypothetical protein M3Y77_06045 [Actinomycetota bacterium]|nr:hypothetical protein [Actinomycetota bacterium]
MAPDQLKSTDVGAEARGEQATLWMPFDGARFGADDFHVLHGEVWVGDDVVSDVAVEGSG